MNSISPKQGIVICLNSSCAHCRARDPAQLDRGLDWVRVAVAQVTGELTGDNISNLPSLRPGAQHCSLSSPANFALDASRAPPLHVHRRCTRRLRSRPRSPTPGAIIVNAHFSGSQRSRRQLQGPRLSSRYCSACVSTVGADAGRERRGNEALATGFKTLKPAVLIFLASLLNCLFKLAPFNGLIEIWFGPACIIGHFLWAAGSG